LTAATASSLSPLFLTDTELKRPWSRRHRQGLKV
jgi:hypothetical protein